MKKVFIVVTTISLIFLALWTGLMVWLNAGDLGFDDESYDYE